MRQSIDSALTEMAAISAEMLAARYILYLEGSNDKE